MVCRRDDRRGVADGDGRRLVDRRGSGRGSAADQVAEAPDAVRDGIQRVVDADKLDCLFQAIEYREQGKQNTQQFVDSMTAALTTTSARPCGCAGRAGGTRTHDPGIMSPLL